MVNRSIEAKKLKMKRRGRFAVFSGATTKFAVRVTEVVETIGEDKARIKRIEVPVGPVSLSKQVMSTGRGPDNERMAQYYSRLNSFSEQVPKTRKGHFSAPMAEMMLKYQSILDECRMMYVSIVKTELGTLDLFFKTKPDGKTEWFFVDVDFKKKVFRRSRVYGSKRFAMERLTNNGITWVETLVLPITVA